MLKYKDKQFDRILTERELEQEWIYGEYDEDFDDWIQALIKEEEIELIKEER
jgi:hypothetical protein